MAPTLDALVAAGFPKLTTGDFFEVFLQVVDGVGPDGNCKTASDLETAFNDQELSDYTVMYLRLLTSLELQSNADFYQNFLDEGRVLRDFCATDVEPMFVESDHIHITALTAATGIRVRVAYLDRGANANATTHNFPDDGAAEPKVHLLYRPGHYDVLYPKSP
jgi:ubiquitin thioesterase protein OTUB1